MIHLNKGDKPHVWMTEEEFEKAFPDFKRPEINPAWHIMGQVLRRRREAKDLSLREFSKLAGWKVSFTSEIEVGIRKSTDPQILKKYTEILDHENDLSD